MISCGIPTKALVRLEPFNLTEFRRARALAVPKAQKCCEDGKKVTHRIEAAVLCVWNAQNSQALGYILQELRVSKLPSGTFTVRR